MSTSVVVVSRNRAAQLEKLLRALKFQTHKNFEVCPFKPHLLADPSSCKQWLQTLLVLGTGLLKTGLNIRQIPCCEEMPSNQFQLGRGLHKHVWT